METKLDELYGEKYVRADYEAIYNMNVRLDIEALPFPDSTFDLVLCFGVLEHVRRHITAMFELSRVVEKSGKVLIHVPLQFETHGTWEEKLGKVGRRKRYGQSNHLRYFGLDIEDQLSEFFTRVDVIKPSDQFSHEDMARFGFVEKSRLIVCHKYPHTALKER